MKIKRILYTLCSVAVVTIVAFATYTEIQNHRQMSDLMRKNLRALTSGEGGSSVNYCPDPYDVPNHFIVVEEVITTVKCTKAGELNIAAQNITTITGNFKRGKEYSVVYSKKNCSGEQTGACCKQSEVGLYFVNVK